jgi:hypothetical protein
MDSRGGRTRRPRIQDILCRSQADSDGSRGDLILGQDYTDEDDRNFSMSQLNPIRVPLVEQGLVFLEERRLSLFRKK